MNISAYLGVAGLLDTGYRFYTTAEVAVAARVTTGIIDAGDGWYSAEVTLTATTASVRWDSTGTAEAKAREYWPDPWGLPIPDGYPAGTAGKILGDNINATISSRATPAQVQTELGTYGALKPTVAARTLDVTATGECGIDLDNTVGTLAKGTDIIGFNDLSAANIQTELTTYGALKPTVAARTLDVSAGGEAGVDWANVGSPATTQNLSATTISTSQVVASVVNPVTLTAAYDAAKTAASQASVNTIDDFVDTEVGAIKTVTDKLDTALELDGAVYRYTANALEQAPTGGGGGADPWNVLLPGAYGAGTAGKILGDNLDAKVSTRMGASSYVAPDNAGIAAIKAKTDTIPANPASVSDIPTPAQNASATRDVSNASPPAGSLGADVKAGIGGGGGGSADPVAIADEVLKRDWNLVSGEAAESLLQAARFLRNHWEAKPDGTLTVYKENGTDVAWSRTIGIDPNAKPIVSVT